MHASTWRFGTARSVAWAVVALLAAGCGSGLYPTTGELQDQDGQPATDLVGGAASFESPDRARGGRALIGADGKFRMATLKGEDGAAPGEYRVLVVPGINLTAKNPAPCPIPERYF